MSTVRPFTRVIEILNQVGLRPTRQRLALARLLFDGEDRHVIAEQLHDEAVAASVPVSLATVYNTLHQFTAVDLLREVVVEPGRSYFDTNTDEHHHFFYEDNGEIQDIPAEAVAITSLPRLPDGAALSRVDVVVRLNGQPHSARRRAGK
jgi:Fur family iron response transcriptional regulator